MKHATRRERHIPAFASYIHACVVLVLRRAVSFFRTVFGGSTVEGRSGDARPVNRSMRCPYRGIKVSSSFLGIEGGVCWE